MSCFRPANRRSTSAARHAFIAAAIAPLALLVATMMPAAAEQPAAAKTASTATEPQLQFRRIYVPDDLIDGWPRHGMRYVPMDASEFEKAAARLNSPAESAVPKIASESAAPPKAEVRSGFYEARLEGDVLTGGTAMLQIEHDGKSATVLPLDPCGLAIQSPKWIDLQANQDAAPVGSRATERAANDAALGTEADGKLVVRTDRSGTLRFNWSLVGRHETGGAISFDVQLPPAASNRLRLALPADLIPSVDQGFISRDDEAGQGQSADNDRSTGPDTSAKPKADRHWMIDFEGQSNAVVRVAKSDFFRENRPLTLVRQSLAYDFSPRGLQLSTDLKLDVLGEPIRRIAVLVDSPLELVTARFSGTQLPWYESDAPETKTGELNPSAPHASHLVGANAANTARPSPRRIVIELPEPLRGTGRIVRLGFTAPPILRGRLPTVRPNADGLYWQEGNASLVVPMPLELNELTLAGCRQTKTDPLPRPMGGASISLQYFRPDADVIVAVGRRSERPAVQSGTMIDVRSSAITARFLADVSVQDGECFNLSADVSPNWVIDGVETIPPDSLADWSVTQPSNSPGVLQVVLAKPVRADRPLKLAVTGRWRRSFGQELRANDLALLELRDVNSTRRLTAIRIGGPYRMQTSGGDDLNRIDPARLSTADSALLGGATGEESLVLVDDDAARNLAVRFSNEAPQFSGSIRIEARVADNSIVERYRIVCRPESGELDRLLVQFSEPRDEPLRWDWFQVANGAMEEFAPNDALSATAISVAAATAATAGLPSTDTPDTEDQIVAQRLSLGEKSAFGLGNRGEVWELTFRKPTSKPFELRATRSTPLKADTPLSLASLVNANDQRGALAIWSTGRRLPEINNQRLTPIPIERPALEVRPTANVLPPSSSATELFPPGTMPGAVGPAPPAVDDSLPAAAVRIATYEYSPAEEIVSAALQPTPPPSLTVSPGGDRPAAWAWSCRLDSYYSADGSSEHIACWRVENTARSQVRLQMPRGANFHAAWIDGKLQTVNLSSIDTVSAGIRRALRQTGDASAAIQVAAKAPTAGANQPIVLDLPSGRRFVNVALQWGSDDGALSLVSSRASLLPEIDMPVFSRRWHVWLAPRFGISDIGFDAKSSFVAPVNWSQRLFGPLGKSAGEPAFDPLDLRQWISTTRSVVGHDDAWNQAEQYATRIERRVKAAVAEKAAYDARVAAQRRRAALGIANWSAANAGASPAKVQSPPSGARSSADSDADVAPFAVLTWGELLSRARVEGRGKLRRGNNELPILIDAVAMADIGLSPESPVPLSSVDATEGSTLDRADLMLLDDPRAIVLTSRSAAAASSVPWSAARSVVERPPPGPFGELLGASLAGNDERFVPVDFWSFSAGKISRTFASRGGEHPAVDHAGWQVYDFDLSDSSREIRIVDRGMMLALGCGLFVLTLLLVFAKGDVSFRQQGIVMTMATAIALLLPASYVPLGAGLWLGLASGWMLRCIARWDRPLGAYSRRLLAVASRFAGAHPPAEIVPTSGPIGLPGDTTLTAPTIGIGAALPGDVSQPGSGSLPPSSSHAPSRKPNGPLGPMLGVLVALGCLLLSDVRAAEPAAENHSIESIRSNPAPRDVSVAQSKTDPVKSADANNSQADSIFDVLIPCDEQERPKGSVYFVPERLYRELIRIAAGSARPAQDWLLTSASYHGNLVRRDQSASLDTADWSADFDLEVFSAPAHVSIPLGGQGTNLLPDGLRVDGQPALFQWEGDPSTASVVQKPSASPRGVGFDISTVGHHKLSLAFRPTATEQAGATSIDLFILPLATSRLELTAPAGVSVEFPNALGAQSIERSKKEQTTRITKWLGPTDRLTLHAWPETRIDVAKPPVFDVDELYWLKVRPGSVTLEARFNVRVANGRLTQLRLLEDPRLRRLPLEPDASISEVRTEEGDLHTMYVGMAQPVVDRTSFKLSFLLTDTSGIGNLRLPRLEALGARFVDRRLAVSVESPLEFDAPAPAGSAAGGPGAAPVAPAQFLTAWGAADASPQLAYTLPVADTSWTLPIHPRQATVESSEQTVISLTQNRLYETWLADLTVLDGTIFQFKLTAPPDWNVEEATLRQEGSPDQPVRWARAPDGSLTLFLPGAAPDNSQLLVRGSMPLAIQSAPSHGLAPVLTLPDLQIAGPSLARVVSRTALLLRGDDAQVSVADPAVMRRTGTAAMRAAVRRALDDGLLEQAALAHLRPVAFLVGHGLTVGSPAIRIVANAPRLEGKQVTTVERSESPSAPWSAAVDLELTVGGGVLDGLRFYVSPQWTDISVTPPMPTQLVDIPGESRRQLVLRPAEPWSGTLRLHMTGSIVTPLGERVRVPDVRPLGISKLHRYILLPARAGDQNLSWEASGVNWQQLPKQFTPGSSPLDLSRTCEVVDEHFDVSLKSIEKTVGTPRVHLEDVAATCSDNGQCYGIATFDLEPKGALNCVVELAPNERLINVRADGIAAPARPVGANHWNTSLGDRRLPQRIEVVFTAELTSAFTANNRLPLVAPSLLGLTPDQTIWSITAANDGATIGAAAAARDATDGSVVGSGHENANRAELGLPEIVVSGGMIVSPLDRDKIRLKTIANLLQAASATPDVEPDGQIGDWFGLWVERLRRVSSDIGRRRAANSFADEARALASDAKHIEEQATKLAAQLGVEQSVKEQLASRSIDDAAGFCRRADHVGQIGIGFEGPSLSLALPGHGLSEPLSRILTAIFGTGIVGLLFWLGSRPGRFSSAFVFPGVAGMAIGLFWWLAMEPSWLGLLILLGGAIAAMRASRSSSRRTDTIPPLSAG